MKFGLTILLCSTLLTACNSEDFDIRVGKDGVQGKTEIQLINASTLPLDYHVGYYSADGKAPDIKASRYRVGSLESGQDSLKVKASHNWSDERLSLQAFHRLNSQSSDFLHYKSPVGKALTLVAWQDDAQLKLTVFQTSSSSQNGVYRLRFLATANNIELKAAQQRFALKKGELSPWISLNHCQGELTLNAQPVDVCQATAGLSFLAVVNPQKILSLTQN